jgi:hypothetical protein
MQRQYYGWQIAYAPHLRNQGLGNPISDHYHAKDGGRNRYSAFGVQPETTLPIVISYSRSYKFLVHRFAGFEIDGSEIPFGFAA